MLLELEDISPEQAQLISRQGDLLPLGECHNNVDSGIFVSPANGMQLATGRLQSIKLGISLVYVQKNKKL